MQVIHASFNDYWRIEDDYLRNDVARRKLPHNYTAPIVDPATLEVKAAQSSPSVEPSGISQPSSVPSCTFGAPNYFF